jgi:hypothetical protein
VCESFIQTIEASDAAVLAGISAAFLVLRNIRKNSKNTGDRERLFKMSKCKNNEGSGTERRRSF